MVSKLDLPSVVGDIVMPAATPDRKAVNDAVSALAVLGFSNSEIRSALSGVDTSGMSTEQIIKLVLRNLNS